MATKQPYSQGAQVEHNKFGLGSVVSCTDEYIVIKFDEHGREEIRFVNGAWGFVKKSDRQPPVEKRATRARKKCRSTAEPAQK